MFVLLRHRTTVGTAFRECFPWYWVSKRHFSDCGFTVSFWEPSGNISQSHGSMDCQLKMTICETGLRAKSVAKIDCKNDESQLNTAAQYYTYAVLPFSGLQSNHLLIGPITHCYGMLRFIVGLQDDPCLLSRSGWALQLFRSCCCLHQSSALRLALPAAILHLIASASLLFYDQRLCLSRKMWVLHLPSRKPVCAKEDRIFRHCNCQLTSPGNMV